MKRMSPRPIFIYPKIPLEVLLGKMTHPYRQYSSQVFTFEESRAVASTRKTEALASVIFSGFLKIRRDSGVVLMCSS